MSLETSLRFSCPHCEQHIECDGAWAGQVLQCPTCAQTLTVPSPPEAPPPLARLLPERPVTAAMAEPGLPLTDPKAQPDRQARRWATFSLATPFTMWVLAKLLAGLSPSLNVVVGFLFMMMAPVALVFGIRALWRLWPGRARGWVRALFGVGLNSLFVLMVLIILLSAVVRRMNQ